MDYKIERERTDRVLGLWSVVSPEPPAVVSTYLAFRSRLRGDLYIFVIVPLVAQKRISTLQVGEVFVHICYWQVGGANVPTCRCVVYNY